VGKLTISRRYNLLPLLRSNPGGFTRSWPYRTCPYAFLKASAKVQLFFKIAILIPNFFVTLDKLLRLGIKNMQAYFVLLSTFRNFAGVIIFTA